MSSGVSFAKNASMDTYQSSMGASQSSWCLLLSWAGLQRAGLCVSDAKQRSSCSMLPGAPASPVGDVLQTPQFQLRRLKKQLAIERENRDELEMELAENRKLITEKGWCLGGCPGHREGSPGQRPVGLGLSVMALTLLEPRSGPEPR